MPRPNVLWLMTDEQRTDSLGCYGSAWAQTPHLDRLAAGGTVFDHAVTPAPVCVPARISLFTGQDPHVTGVWWNDGGHGRTLPHLTSHFADAGYRTASFGKQDHHGVNAAFQTERGPVLSDEVHYFSYADGLSEEEYGVLKFADGPHPWIFAGVFPGPEERTAEAQVVDETLAWLDEGDEPFLLHVSFNAPHTPVVPPARFRDAMDPSAIDLPVETESLPDDPPEWIRDGLLQIAGSASLGPKERAIMRQHYYAQVAFVDDQFGRLLRAMDAAGHLDNTIIAYVSDHGTHLGDFGLVQKQTFFEPVVTVPYFFSWPGVIRGGVHIDTPAETRRLMPTLLDLAEVPAPQEVLVESLAPALRGDTSLEQRPVFSEFTLGSFGLRQDERLVMVRDEQWKLTMSMDAPEDRVLIDLDRDPYERHNLRAEEPAVVRRLEELIRQTGVTS